MASPLSRFSRLTCQGGGRSMHGRNMCRICSTSTALKPNVPWDPSEPVKRELTSVHPHHIELRYTLIPDSLCKLEIDQPRTTRCIEHDVAIANIAVNPAVSVQNLGYLCKPRQYSFFARDSGVLPSQISLIEANTTARGCSESGRHNSFKTTL